ncbi:cytochrome o ubiquinol oxidase subunit III [Candidatus Liberibacter sp.]|uniref:cytochrome o ubiquinol oxidase subunit III n=1 Tax=Candidatus Liberibacter sp. TaxID=34022 RepID=UPI0015F65DD7|nr:cytochrome o ubiquinol oxidase subunit III [Candidatus Liberibacter sp.]MBA5724148.1 cytochrome o ubiquinol oxidase subunit III [Candidatus Liberibacter sp.]
MTKCNVPEVQSKKAPVFYLKEDRDNHSDNNNGTQLGFWIYLMSDCLMFSVLFITYAVIGHNYAVGPAPIDLFDIGNILIATFVLLCSSMTYGFAMLCSEKRLVDKTVFWLLATAFFGVFFVVMEVHEFWHLISIGATPQRSAFLSAFFALVGAHGLHVVVGLGWIFVLVIQLLKHGLILENRRRLMCLSMFWHFLDLIWICVFSFVYLMGVF